MSIKDRKYRRIILPKDKRAETVISLLTDRSDEENNSGSRKINAIVMNCSEGGLGFSILRKGFWKLCSLDMIKMNSISGESPFTEMSGLSLQIKWVLDNSELNILALDANSRILPMNSGIRSKNI